MRVFGCLLQAILPALAPPYDDAVRGDLDKVLREPHPAAGPGGAHTEVTTVADSQFVVGAVVGLVARPHVLPCAPGEPPSSLSDPSFISRCLAAPAPGSSRTSTAIVAVPADTATMHRGRGVHGANWGNCGRMRRARLMNSRLSHI